MQVDLGLGQYVHPEHTDKPPLDISLVPNYQVRTIWPAVVEHLRSAIDIAPDRYTVSDVLEKLISGEAHLWVAFTPDLSVVGAATSSFTYYPSCRALTIYFLGGSRFEDWQDKICDVFDRWGRENRCKFVEFTGRAGWKKVLKRNGYEEISRVYQREL